MTSYSILCVRSVLFTFLAIATFAIVATAQTAPSDELASLAPAEIVVAPMTEPPAPPEPVAPVAPVAPVVPVAPAHPWIGLNSATASGAPAPAAVADDDEDWHGSIMMYGFLSSINGELRARDQVVEVDRSFGDITDVLKFAVGFRFDAQYKKWGFAFDNNYVKVGDDVTTDRVLAPDFRFDLALNVTEIEATYRLYSTGDQDDPVGGPKFAVDALGGVRIVHLSTDLEIRRAIATDVFRDASGTYVHGYLGNRFIASPSKYIAFIGRYNLSLASDFSWFVNGSVEIRPWEHLAFGGGLQVLDLSLEKDSTEAALDARFAGPVLYLRVHF